MESQELLEVRVDVDVGEVINPVISTDINQEMYGDVNQLTMSEDFRQAMLLDQEIEETLKTNPFEELGNGNLSPEIIELYTEGEVLTLSDYSVMYFTLNTKDQTTLMPSIANNSNDINSLDDAKTLSFVKKEVSVLSDFLT